MTCFYVLIIAYCCRQRQVLLLLVRLGYVSRVIWASASDALYIYLEQICAQNVSLRGIPKSTAPS
jgi:hypothetical protein